jgi:hypothetical protein
MNRMTPDLARLLVEDRLTEAEQRMQRRTARGGAVRTTKVPRQRGVGGLMTRFVPGYGVRAPTR